MCNSYLIPIRKAYSLPPINGDSNYEENAGGVRKVATALKKGEEEVDECVPEPKMKGKGKKVRD